MFFSEKSLYLHSFWDLYRGGSNFLNRTRMRNVSQLL